MVVLVTATVGQVLCVLGITLIARISLGKKETLFGWGRL